MVSSHICKQHHRTRLKHLEERGRPAMACLFTHCLACLPARTRAITTRCILWVSAIGQHAPALRTRRESMGSSSGTSCSVTRHHRKPTVSASRLEKQRQPRLQRQGHGIAAQLCGADKRPNRSAPGMRAPSRIIFMTPSSERRGSANSLSAYLCTASSAELVRQQNLTLLRRHPHLRGHAEA
jgi:hypothetical protein